MVHVRKQRWDLKQNCGLHAKSIKNICVMRGNLPHSDVKDVTPNRTWNGHVTIPLFGNDDASDEIRDAGASCQKG